MILFKFKNDLNQKGFSHHLVLPVVVILAVVAVGSHVLLKTHAQSLPQTDNSNKNSTTNPLLQLKPSSTNLITQTPKASASTLPGPNIINYPPTLGQDCSKYTCTGPAVTGLQVILWNLGDGNAYQDGVGHFGAHTLAEVKAFQLYHNLTIDGIVGQHTWGGLFTVISNYNNEAMVGAPSVSNFSLVNDGSYIKLRSLSVPSNCRELESTNLAFPESTTSPTIGASATAGHSAIFKAASGPNIISTVFYCGPATGVTFLFSATAWATIQH